MLGSGGVQGDGDVGTGGSGSGGVSGAGGRVVSGVALDYCDDYAHWPDGERTCASDGDCPVGQRCADNWYAEPCNLGCAAQQVGCNDVQQCQAGEVCAQQRVEPPSPPDVVPLPALPVCSCGEYDTGRRCVQPCSVTGCAADERCGDDGQCVLLSCSAGEYECPAGSTCGDAATDHGCRPLSCAESGGEPCGDNLECLEADAGAYCNFKPCVASSDCDCGTCRQVPGAGLHGEPSSVWQCRGRPGICISDGSELPYR